MIIESVHADILLLVAALWNVARFPFPFIEKRSIYLTINLSEASCHPVLATLSSQRLALAACHHVTSIIAIPRCLPIHVK